jgi:nicotinamidase-related amidase
MANEKPSLLDRAVSSLLLVDLQARLVPAIHTGAAVVEHAIWLARLARELGVPTTITEHVAHKIGPTVEPLRAACPEARIAGKASFSAAHDGCLIGTAVEALPQVVVCGTETHVCVLQTVLDLCAAGKSLFVVAEACGSRRVADHALALERMRQHGVQIVTREMVAFEWLRRADTPQFGRVLREFIR